MKTNNIILRQGIALIAVMLLTFLHSSCKKWTDVEPLNVADPRIQTQNPGLYAQYLQNLRTYKQGPHKYAYAWFDNQSKVPQNRAQHLYNLPDSLDYIALQYPDNLADFERADISKVRSEKGTMVIFSFDYEAVKWKYDSWLAGLGDNTASGTVPPFNTFLRDTLAHALSLVDEYDYDGFSLRYTGKALLHLTEEERQIQEELEHLIVGAVSTWKAAHTSKELFYEGLPQFLIDKSILNSAKHIILPYDGITASYGLTQLLQQNRVEGVPADRFIVSATTVPIASTETGGTFSNGQIALLGTANWIASVQHTLQVQGIGIYQVQNDYFDVAKVFRNTRAAIGIINPSIKN